MSASAPPRTKKQRTLLRLFEEQGGLCWICDMAMTPPVFDRGGRKAPSAFAATIDHLAPPGPPGTKNPKRPTRAAHLKCNTVRHHLSVDDPKVTAHVAKMRAALATAGEKEAT